MGNASSVDMMRRCVGMEVAQPIVKSLAGATQHVFEVSKHDFGRHVSQLLPLGASIVLV